MQNTLQRFFLLLPLMLAACAAPPSVKHDSDTAAVVESAPEWAAARKPVYTLYCDNFFIYEMCAKDIDNNGDVDLVYFSDSKEIFLYREDVQAAVSADLSFHTCAQPMDEELAAIGSELLYISDDMSFFERLEIKRRMLTSYARYKPQINACRKENGIVDSSVNSNFGDENFDDL